MKDRFSVPNVKNQRSIEVFDEMRMDLLHLHAQRHRGVVCARVHVRLDELNFMIINLLHLRSDFLFLPPKQISTRPFPPTLNIFQICM